MAQEVTNDRRPGWRITPAAWLVFSSAVALVGCERWAVEKDAGVAVSSAAATEEAAAPAGVVDSIFPMDEMLERFRKGLTEPQRLGHGLPTREALIEHVVRALAANDTAAFETVAVDRAEFAWLYFPTTAIAKPPYELPPELTWFRMQGENRKGVFRALREFGGHRLELVGTRCPEPQVEASNRIWVGCSVTIRKDGGEPMTLELFESILERDGRFAMLSYANSF